MGLTNYDNYQAMKGSYNAFLSKGFNFNHPSFQKWQAEWNKNGGKMKYGGTSDEIAYYFLQSPYANSSYSDYDVVNQMRSKYGLS